MRILKSASWALAGIICLIGASGVWHSDAHATEADNIKLVPVVAGGLDNASCQTCHDGKKEAIKVPVADGKPRTLHAINDGKYAKSVHAKMQCVECHKEITDSTAQHKIDLTKKVSCVQCHEDLWAAAKKENKTQQKPRLGVVVQNIESYKKSFHARQNEDEPTRVNATCDGCHDTHVFNVPPKGSAESSAWRLTIPKVCGENCHTEQLETYETSAHGKEIVEKSNAKAAVCSDCHTSHDITGSSSEPFKLGVTKACGGCHKEQQETYADTYHGQINKLGYAYSAKCYNCHGSHEILGVKEAKSKIHPDNRLKTCKQCHDGKKELKEATAGFVTFDPHANDHDFKKYPQMWIASKFMLALLIGVFAFFWLHSGLWHYREYMDRKQGKSHPHVKTEELLKGQTKVKQVRRFGGIWRLAHLLFALSTMTLVFTGMIAFYSASTWAPVAVSLIGGPKVAAWAHRVAATVFLVIFFSHLVYMVLHLFGNKKFKWFGPDSLVPNWNDLKGIVGLFKWFIGKGPRPTFERWTYWEKFDYWAVFWGVAIIGGSGLMLAYPNVTATYLPGWMFNVLTLIHGEEAFLAAVFLFTVHFFNNHFRPDKFPPPDVVMFTGSVPLEEFKREHTDQYNRLVETGQLDKYLVDVPSRPMTIGSKILGLTLLAVGLTLLTLVFWGLVGSLTR